MADFTDLTSYLALPRVQDLRLAPDGKRLVATVATVDDEGTKFRTSLWDIDPTGVAPARRLTWSAKGESSPRFRSDGSLLFLSTRDEDDDDAVAAAWLLPAHAGEARKWAERPGGVAATAAARTGDVVVVASPTFPGAADATEDERRRSERKDLKVGAVLHESSPVRYWDHDLGPAELRLFAASASADAETAELRDLTPEPGRSLNEQDFVLSPDGSTLVSGWAVVDEPGLQRPQLVAIDVATGDRRVIADEAYVSYGDPDISPDGTKVVCVRTVDGTYDEPPEANIWLIDLSTGAGRALSADMWPASPRFSADGSIVFFIADDHGNANVFRVPIGGGDIERVTRTGHHTNLCVAPDGATLFALRDHIDAPPTPVRIDASATNADAQPLPSPGRVDVHGSLDDVSTVVEDGTTVRGWLALPPETSADTPAPLLVWIHGGPLSSWNSWSWRWNPWLLAARGYAVLLPDPALSTGYGQDMLRRGWGQWGGSPYSDVMAITDEVIKRPDIDETRTAAMGGSYGGYLSNWVAGHTDRFRCIVTHASLWALEQFQGTTDFPAYWAREWGLPTDQPERYEQWSPNKFAADVRTPMLVIHGDKDYRVPVGEGLRLWWDLQRLGVESKYLYFPDEGHWILKPGNVRVWYETVFAWLATHVLGEKWERPALL